MRSRTHHRGSQSDARRRVEFRGRSRPKARPENVFTRGKRVTCSSSGDAVSAGNTVTDRSVRAISRSPGAENVKPGPVTFCGAATCSPVPPPPQPATARAEAAASWTGMRRRLRGTLGVNDKETR